MKRVVFLMLCSLSLLAMAAQGDVTTLIAVEDTYVDSVDSSGSGITGSETELSIQGYAPGFRSLESYQASYLKFDLSDIPDNAVITGAVFGIYYSGQNTGLYSAADPYAYLHYVGSDAWSEGSLNWNDADTLNVDNQAIEDESKPMPDEDEAIEWDLFSGVGFNWTNWQDDLEDNYISLLMTVEDMDINNYANFYSSEYDIESMRPYLNLTYSVVPEPTSMTLVLVGLSGYLTAKRRKHSR